MNIIEQLRKEKEKIGISYDEIALRSGLPKTTVTNVMCGYTKRPRIDTIQKIQNTLGIADSIYTAEDYANGIRNTKKISVTADQEEIFDATNEVINLLGDKGKELIIDFCNMLKEKFGK